jgi:elongation factor Tu
MPVGLFRRGRHGTAACEPVATLDAAPPAVDASASVWAEPGGVLEDGFRMTVAESFTIAGRGTVLTGIVDSGSVRVGDVVEIASPRGVAVARVVGIKRSAATSIVAAAGDHVGLLIGGPDRAPATPGSVVTSDQTRR